MKEWTYYSFMPSPVGRLTLRWNDDALSGVGFEGRPDAEPGADWVRDDERLVEVRRQLGEYFRGEREVFELPLVVLGGTAFQREVWETLRTIPYGVTWSYGELAQRIGREKAVRAVGAANGQNPLAIVVPCHRVIGANGSLTGFGGGLPNKKWLLELESRQPSLLPERPRLS